MYVLFIAAILGADNGDKATIPDDVLVYLKAEEAARESLIDVHQKEIARLKVAYKRASVAQRTQLVAATKSVMDRIKKIEEESPFLFRYPGPPSIGQLGRLDEATPLGNIISEERVFALVKVKHNKVKFVGASNPLEDEVLSYVLISGPDLDVNAKAVLAKDQLYRAVKIERDSDLAVSAFAKIPKASQASVSGKANGPIRHLVVLEKVDSQEVDEFRDQFAKLRARK